MRKTRRTEITIETHRVWRVTRPPRYLVGWCDECDCQVLMLTPDYAAASLRLSPRLIYRWLETGQLHRVELADGSVLICQLSLRRWTNISDTPVSKPAPVNSPVAPAATIPAQTILPERETRQAALLSERERKVLSLFAEGLSQAQIADRLNLASTELTALFQSLYQKLGTSDRLALIIIAFRIGAPGGSS